MAMTKRKGPDTLDKTVTYLAKRDGIDKVLKVIRYSTKLALATALKNDSGDLAVRLKEFETSIGTSRKAYRLGKWLSDLNTLRNTPVLTKAGSLELLASGGEGVYYFVEQLTWLVKAGLLDKKYAKRFSTISAWAELVGYVGNVTLNGLRIAAALERELMLTQELVRRKKEDDTMPDDVHLIKEVQALRARRLLRTLAVVQDLSDALMAVNDVTDGRSPMNSSAVLSVCGLTSACISVHKNWPGAQEPPLAKFPGSAFNV
ncbi:hypothetical protein WJX79_006130 [Trebouxia sp. C0005]